MTIDEGTRKILEKVNYTNPIRYISGNIVEYDIKAANINILYNKGIINQEYYQYLSRLPKGIREREIGLIEEKDPSIYEKIAEGIKEYKLKLAEANNINSFEIIRVANDAVYINRSRFLDYTTFDNIIFKASDPINIYINLTKSIIVLATIQKDGNISLDIKGISKDNISMFQYTILQIIGTVIFLIERSSIQDAVRYLSGILEDYINKRLDIEYYREFTTGYFIVNNGENRFAILQSNGLNIDDLDINTNLYILRELWGVILEKYGKMIR